MVPYNFDREILREQLVVAMVAEMIHTASLVHDDVVDDSMLRRGEPSVFSHWGMYSSVTQVTAV